MPKQKVVVGDGKSGLAVVPTALFTTDVLLQNLEITSGARINAWVESMRASSPTFNRQDKTTWMVYSHGNVFFSSFVLSLADADPHFMMEDESLLWTSNDVIILLQHGSEKIPLNFVLSLADADPHFMMEDESLLWTSNDVIILLQHGSEKIPLKDYMFFRPKCNDIQWLSRWIVTVAIVVMFCCGSNSFLAILDKVGLDVSVNITGLGSSAGTGSGVVSLTGGAGKDCTICVKTVSNTKVFLLKVLLLSKWN
nr:haloacid dehalogenase-like hydrolase (HAD) superfamily protein [Tanacetum cinerariifolium]